MHADMSGQAAHDQALARLYSLVQVQAAALSYVDAYWLLAVSAAVMFFISFVLRRNEPGKGRHTAMHEQGSTSN
jgi:hypothetical protein